LQLRYLINPDFKTNHPGLEGAIERLKEAAAQADEKEKSHGACDENCYSTARVL